MKEQEVINRVANSGLINIDLSSYAPKENILEIDIKQFLFKGLILKEKDFRLALKSFNFEHYREKTVAIYCSSNTIVPMWAYMLVTTCLNDIGSKIFFGNKSEVFQSVFLENVYSIDSDDFIGKKVLVNGCGNVVVSARVYIAITKKLQKKVKSLMFGEACSAVPIYKKNK